MFPSSSFFSSLEKGGKTNCISARFLTHNHAQPSLLHTIIFWEGDVVQLVKRCTRMPLRQVQFPGAYPIPALYATISHPSPIHDHIPSQPDTQPYPSPARYTTMSHSRSIHNHVPSQPDTQTISHPSPIHNHVPSQPDTQPCPIPA